MLNIFNICVACVLLGISFGLPIKEDEIDELIYRLQDLKHQNHYGGENVYRSRQSNDHFNDGEYLSRNLDSIGGGYLVRTVNNDHRSTFDPTKEYIGDFFKNNDQYLRKYQPNLAQFQPQQQYMRSLDSIGGGHLIRSLDSIGGANLIRNLDHIGGGHLVRNVDDDTNVGNDSAPVKRNLDSIGGANLLKRTLDSIGGAHLLK